MARGGVAARCGMVFVKLLTEMCPLRGLNIKWLERRKTDHYACVITADGDQVLAQSVRNDETAVADLFYEAASHSAAALVIDTTGSTAALLMHAAAQQNMPVAYVTGLTMRRAADLYAGAAKTDPKDAAVLADYARRHADRSGLGQPRRRTPGQLADTQRP